MSQDQPTKPPKEVLALAGALCRRWITPVSDTLVTTLLPSDKSPGERLREHEAFMDSLFSLIVPHRDGARLAIIAFPCRPVELEAGNDYIRLKLRFFSPTIPPAIVGATAAVQFLGKRTAFGTRPPQGMIAGWVNASATAQGSDLAGPWTDVELYSKQASAVELVSNKMKELSAVAGLIEGTVFNRSVVHQARNKYGEVVAVAYGPAVQSVAYSERCRQWDVRFHSALAEAGFFRSLDADPLCAALMESGAVVDPRSSIGVAIQEGTHLASLAERFGAQSVLGRLRERFEDAERISTLKQQEERRQAFERSMTRGRRIFRDPE